MATVHANPHVASSKYLARQRRLEQRLCALQTCGWEQRLQPLATHMVEKRSADMVNGVAGHFATFDASHIAQRARRLTLRLTLPVVSMVEKLDGAQSASAPCESYQDGGTISVGGFTGHACLVTVHRPLSVTFTVPGDPARREVAPHEPLTVGGTTLMLERVVVTRTEARVYLRCGAPGHLLQNAAVTLTIGKHRYGGRVIDGCPSGQYSGFEARV